MKNNKKKVKQKDIFFKLYNQKIKQIIIEKILQLFKRNFNLNKK